ncbi:hypothetical protein J2795_002068 [Chryseobacterium bernardetii]|jgi:hypothetical protein|uniref:Uncharacterized protein n=1 Tax=Chryseobacterium bernardetii TaxID=1241978 RepID=A0ACC6IUM4_9FLAO|nr:hypothetical protein [Chryseobacterium sp. PvR013]MDR6370886.1 hypothetical protein [Chryseobacterium vietnamense]MDR6441368.1 hypothetical protein [Chryseobacterium bernardetii]MDR6461569.1 hypothetical protein [Chryseobacterium sediminis]
MENVKLTTILRMLIVIFINIHVQCLKNDNAITKITKKKKKEPKKSDISIETGYRKIRRTI